MGVAEGAVLPVYDGGGDLSVELLALLVAMLATELERIWVSKSVTWACWCLMLCFSVDIWFLTATIGLIGTK